METLEREETSKTDTPQADIQEKEGSQIEFEEKTASDEEAPEEDSAQSAGLDEDLEDEEDEASAKEQETEDREEEEGGKKGFFSRKKDKKEEAAKARIVELEDKVMRQMAEFENFRKRTEKEKATMFETGAKSVIEKILPVVDNFERGLAVVPEENREEPFYDGMNKIYKQLMTELENLGVTPIEAVGEEFNPEVHNAVMQVENEELESGTVAQELQKGYKYRDSVVRHSMVAVVQ